MDRRLPALVLPLLTGLVQAADSDQPAPAPAPASDWTPKGVVGGFLNNVTTSNADVSHDPTINGTTSSTSWSAKLDASLEWRSGKDSVEQILKAEYGRIRQRDQDWVENKDELRYDGVYRRTFAKPHFAYLGWGCETVFTGPEPEREPFDPFLAKVSAGYGQIYENLLPEKDRLEWRLGTRAQKRWGRSVPDDKDGIETGIEAFLRYERQAIIKRDGQDLRYYAQYEGFSQYNDLGHITNLITAGLTYQFLGHLTLDLAIRAFYETRTKDDDGTREGYNQWSLRQDTMLGVAYTF